MGAAAYLVLQAAAAAAAAEQQEAEAGGGGGGGWGAEGALAATAFSPLSLPGGSRSQPSFALVAPLSRSCGP